MSRDVSPGLCLLVWCDQNSSLQRALALALSLVTHAMGLIGPRTAHILGFAAL